MHDIGTMTCNNVANWHSDREAVHFFPFFHIGSFSAFSHYRNKESFSSGFDVELHIPLLVLTPPRSGSLLEFIA